MRSIAILNQKGGVGKTTSAVNIAAGLARAGRDVLLLDLDPQGHASLHLGMDPGPEDKTVYDVLVRGAPLAEALRYASKRLATTAAHIDLVAAEQELVDLPHRETLLRRALESHREHFAYMVVDCAPSLGLLTINALAAVDEVLIPVQPHFFALQGLSKLLETVALVRAHVNPRLRVSGVILCMYESGTRLAQEVGQDIRSFLDAGTPDDVWHGARLFKTVIRKNIKLAEAPSFGKSIFDYAFSSHGAQDYAGLVREILQMENAAPGDVVAEAAADERDLRIERFGDGEDAPSRDGPHEEAAAHPECPSEQRAG